jgi:hypothetical protein
MKKDYVTGIIFCTGAAIPIGLCMAIMCTIEKGWSGFSHNVWFFMSLATFSNLIIASTVGTIWVFLITKTPFANYYSNSVAGSVTGLAIANLLPISFNWEITISSILWGMMAACFFWYGWRQGINWNPRLPSINVGFITKRFAKNTQRILGALILVSCLINSPLMIGIMMFYLDPAFYQTLIIIYLPWTITAFGSFLLLRNKSSVLVVFLFLAVYTLIVALVYKTFYLFISGLFFTASLPGRSIIFLSIWLINLVVLSIIWITHSTLQNGQRRDKS